MSEWGHSTCMGRLVSRPVVQSSNLLVRSTGDHLLVPTYAFYWPLRAATVKGGRRPSRSDLPLTVVSTAACLLVGRRPVPGSWLLYGDFSVGSFHDTEGSSPSGASIAPQTCIRSVHEDHDHDAVMRIGGEAPRRRAHSKPRLIDHVQSRVAATSVRHLQLVINTKANRRKLRGMRVATLPAEAVDLRAPRRLSPVATAQ
jgi:hypothetical protein